MRLPGMLAATFAVALLQACSGGSSATPVRAGIEAPLQSVAQALPAARSDGSAQHIYVTSFNGDEILTFNMDGSPASPTITERLNGPASLAVDSAGKLYVINQWYNSLETFLPNGQGVDPTIYSLRTPGQVAVAPSGQIFISQTDPDGSNGIVRAFTAAGRYSKPTIHFSGLPLGVAVDEAGNIYVSSENRIGGDAFIHTFKPDGTPTPPTIALGSEGLSFLAVSKGKLYAAQFMNNVITTYTLNGRRTTPTIAHVNHPYGVALDRKGNIYVTNFGLENGLLVTTYTPDGTEIEPTIRVDGVPFGIAVH